MSFSFFFEKRHLWMTSFRPSITQIWVRQTHPEVSQLGHLNPLDRMVRMVPMVRTGAKQAESWNSPLVPTFPIWDFAGAFSTRGLVTARAASIPLGLMPEKDHSWKQLDTESVQNEHKILESILILRQSTTQWLRWISGEHGDGVWQQKLTYTAGVYHKSLYRVHNRHNVLMYLSIHWVGRLGCVCIICSWGSMCLLAQVPWSKKAHRFLLWWVSGGLSVGWRRQSTLTLRSYIAQQWWTSLAGFVPWWRMAIWRMPLSFGTVWRRWCTCLSQNHHLGSSPPCHPCGGFHAVWRIAPAAATNAEGSAFRGWGCGHAAPWWCNRACRPQMPGWPLERGRSSWTSCWWRSMLRASTSEILCRWRGMGWCPGLWKHLAVPVSARSSACSVTGSWGTSSGGTQQYLWRHELNPVGVTGGRAQRAMAEWLQFVVDYPDLHIPASCALCGSLTRHLCVGCLVSFCPTCTLDRADPLCCAEALASGDMRLEMPALRFGENTGRIIQHLVRQNMPLVQRRPWRTGPLGPIGSWGGGAILASQHASVWRLRMARAGIGRPVKQSTLVEAGRVAAWRDGNGCRTMAISLFASAAGSRQYPVLGMWWRWRGSRLGSQRLMACCRELTVHCKPPLHYLLGCQSLHPPKFRCGEHLCGWRRMCIHHQRPLWGEWIRWRQCGSVWEPFALAESWLRHWGLTGKLRAGGWHKLWLRRQSLSPYPMLWWRCLSWRCGCRRGSVVWCLGWSTWTILSIKAPLHRRDLWTPSVGYLCWATWRNRLKAFSKPVIRPGPRCWALAGRGGSLALQAYQQVSLATFHAHCPRGKQRRLRGGFDFCIPATFTSGWNWTGPWLELWKELPVEKKGRCGLCFDSHGVAWDLTEVHQQARLCFRNQVETPELMTSYSWRRLMPTVGHLLQFQPASLAALGDWQEKKDEEPSTKMALRYSSARYQESTRVKHLTLSALSQLQGFEAWEMICPENVEEAKHHAERAVNQALHRDGHLVWSTPITASEVAVRFALTTRMKERAAALRRESRHTRAVRSMPDVVNGRQMSSFLRDGGLLCGEYQVEKCTKSEEECGAMHRCGVLLRTGRVCGGRHPGLRCYDKRAILVENGSAALSIQPYPEEAGRAKGGATS